MKEEARMGDYVLVSLRDPGLPTYTWFWMKEDKCGYEHVVSPYFSNSEEAMVWADNNPEWKL